MVTRPTLNPIFLNVGRKRKSRIKRLKRGTGKLVDKVFRAVAEVAERHNLAASGKEIVPVVIVYRQRKRRKNRVTMPGMFG